MSEIFGSTLSGIVLAEYPSGRKVRLDGRFFVYFDPTTGENPAVEQKDTSVVMLDPRAIVSVNGKVVYRPRGRRLTPEMIRWLEENRTWDANKG